LSEGAYWEYKGTEGKKRKKKTLVEKAIES